MSERLVPSTTSDERTMLLEFLNYFRSTVEIKAEGLTDEQARTQCVSPSDMTIMGLIRHLADVERAWFQRVLVGADAPPIFYSKEPGGDIDGDFHVNETDTLDEACLILRREIETSDVNIALHDLDFVTSNDHHGRVSLRWILVHMIEEYARHCGHLDLVRESLDGRVGD